MTSRTRRTINRIDLAVRVAAFVGLAIGVIVLFLLDTAWTVLRNIARGVRNATTITPEEGSL